MRLLLLALLVWAGGFSFAHFLRIRAAIIKECPRCIKCWIASLFALLFGAGEYFFWNLKMVYSSSEYLYAVLFASLFGGAVYLVLCPIRKLDRPQQ